MEMFSEVEWKKSNATTEELVCNCRSESGLHTVTFGEILLRSSFRNLYTTFLISTRQTHFENIHKVPAMDLVHHHNRGLLHFPTGNWISYGDV